MGTSIWCAWCGLPLLEEADARNHVLTKCSFAPGAALYRLAKDLIQTFDGDIDLSRDDPEWLAPMVDRARACVELAEKL